MNPTDGSPGVDGVLWTHWALDAVSHKNDVGERATDINGY